jgi:hypothetical protein
MPYLFWYFTLHFTRSVAMRRASAGMFVKNSSHTGMACSV